VNPVYRILLFVIFAIVMALYDYLRYKRFIRTKEYAAVMLAGLVGGVYGGLNDIVTGTISPEYFIYGKDIPVDIFTLFSAVKVGLIAGISGGCVLGIILIYIRGTWFPQCSMLRTISQFWKPIACGILFSLVFALCFNRFDSFNLLEYTEAFLNPDQQHGFITVWWEHTGVYTGALAGSVWAVLSLRK